MYVFEAIAIGFVSAVLAGMFGIGGAGITTPAIRVLLDAGLNLDAVAELLPCFATDGILGACPTAQRRLSAQIRALDERINGLTATRQTLATALHKIDPGPS